MSGLLQAVCREFLGDMVRGVGEIAALCRGVRVRNDIGSRGVVVGRGGKGGVRDASCICSGADSGVVTGLAVDYSHKNR